MSNFDQSVIALKFTVSGTLAVANGKEFQTLPFNADLVSAYAYVNTAPTGAALNLRLNKNGVSAVTWSVAAAATSGSKLMAYPVSGGTTGVDDSQPNLTAPSGNSGFNYILPEFPAATVLASFAAGDTVSLDVTQVGSTVAGADLTVTLGLVKK